EQRIGRLRRERSEPFYVATKAGRRLQPHTADGYNKENLTRFVERSLRNLGVESLDLLQLHCPPTEVYYRPEVFQALDDLKQEGKIQHYGVSVEKVEEALKAIEYPGVESVQIIFNIFRQRPAELFFREARRRDVAVIARVPLASGLLTGKMTRETTFPPDDHRNYNREGRAFDVGETFAGVPFEVGLEAVEALRPLVPPGATMAQFALRWILMFDAVSVVIPGAKNPRQVEDNARASGLLPPTSQQIVRIREIYDTFIRPYVHHRW
ncbi:MAG: aldo/keto reductase, partial [Anaerolineae bacterium]